MKIGEIWVVGLPTIDGHEQYGVRPAVIVGDPTLSVVIVVPLTTNHRYLKFPYTVLINPSISNGLNQDSVALVFQSRVIDKRRFRNKLGQISGRESKEIKVAFKKLLSL